MLDHRHERSGTFRIGIRAMFLLPVIMAVMLTTVTWIIFKVQEARENARNSSCTNHIVQHTGWHPTVVALDKDLRIVRVSACWICLWYTKPVYYIPQTETWLKPDAVPPGTIARAEEMLAELKITEPYRSCRPVPESGEHEHGGRAESPPGSANPGEK
jgi:hypothetical protein